MVEKCNQLLKKSLYIENVEEELQTDTGFLRKIHNTLTTTQRSVIITLNSNVMVSIDHSIVFYKGKYVYVIN